MLSAAHEAAAGRVIGLKPMVGAALRAIAVAASLLAALAAPLAQAAPTVNLTSPANNGVYLTAATFLPTAGPWCSR